jgi:RHS repeat-associated protein
VENFTYDGVGDRTMAGYTHDANHRMRASPGHTYDYDEDGNLVARDPRTEVELTEQVDQNDRLTAVSTGSSTTTYRYDTSGRRLMKASGVTSTSYLWTGDRLLAEYDAAGIRQLAYAYASELTPNELIVPAGGGSSANLSVHVDRIEAPRLVTGTGASSVWTAAYEAFGSAVAYGGILPVFNLRSPGQYFDSETELHYNVHRFYSPSMGRFIAADPVGLLGHSNLYVFASNNPLIRIDPLGLDDNTVTYGEMREWAITSPTDFTPPPGLADAKASIGAACGRNSVCASVDGSNAESPVDRAAWQNIVNANGGTDQSGGGNFMCVGHQQCWFVHQCDTCRDCRRDRVERDQSLMPSGTVGVSGHTIYFYNDPLRGWDTSANYRSACRCQ